jgi:hypothetical protein
VLLEDHPDVRLGAADRLAVQRDGAARRLGQPVDTPQQRRLASARFTQQDDEFVLDLEGHVLKGGHVTVLFREVLDCQCTHWKYMQLCVELDTDGVHALSDRLVVLQ